MEKYDFSGYVTKANVRCSDGRVIKENAFAHQDGQTVPMVWSHQHKEPWNVLGHVLLENRKDGVYGYGTFNDTENGQIAKELVSHGDITAMSIFANQLQQMPGESNTRSVMHGKIIEVSLVHAGANPSAHIESVIKHSDGGEPIVSEDEGYIYTGEEFALYHSDEESEKEEPGDTEQSEEETENTLDHSDGSEEEAENDLEHSEESEETVGDVFDTLSPKQKTAVYSVIADIVDEFDNKESNENDEGGNNMKHNVFDPAENNQENTIAHSDMMAVIEDAKRYGSMKESALQHGINQIDYMFPEPKSLNTPPEFIKREMGWVTKVLGAVHHTPFSRIKSMFADITEDDARAKGYIKGKLKKEEVFGLLKRTTTPTTIYKKQKMDRDDVIDITDFDVIAWLKAEMRMMLDEEIARAILVGDGRLASSDDKINELNIRPVWKDEDLYTVKATVQVPANADASQKAKAFIRAVIKNRKNYKGSGEPTLYTTEDMLTDMLLIEDTTGRLIYESVDKLKSLLRVREIITVPVMEGLTRTTDAGTLELMGLVVNLKDYNVGADKGGAVNMFDDFDIDYNQQKYLIETRCSGALVKPFSAIALEMQTSAATAE